MEILTEINRTLSDAALAGVLESHGQIVPVGETDNVLIFRGFAAISDQCLVFGINADLVINRFFWGFPSTRQAF